MKIYIKPNTKVQSIELTQMIAQSPGPGMKTENITDNNDVLGKGYLLSPSDMWDDSDEEE